MEPVVIENWMRAYLRAWSTDDPDDIKALFTEDALYFPEPYSDPWEGHGGIVREWIARGDSDRDWSFNYELVDLHDDLAIVRGHTHYAEYRSAKLEPEVDYENLWLIRFAPDGRAREFTEWWMKTKRH
jgi:ketosteroid isomerase-like protein